MTRTHVVVAALSAASLLLSFNDAQACSLAQAPFGAQRLTSADGGIPVLTSADAGADGQAPSTVTMTGAAVTLITNPCDGSGASCPEFDALRFTVSASDDVTAPDGLRFIAAFGATEAEAASADAELLFEADPSDPTQVSAYLGFEQSRSGEHFSREQLCFALAAADEAGNVGPRSTPLCLNTTDATAANTTVVAGQGCVGGIGCTSTPAAVAPAALLLVMAAFAARRVVRNAGR